MRRDDARENARLKARLRSLVSHARKPHPPPPKSFYPFLANPNENPQNRRAGYVAKWKTINIKNLNVITTFI